MPVNLDRYTLRIGWRGRLAPDLETLRGLVSAHTAAIPFENLDPFLGRRVSLDLDDIQDKLVGRRRGGYCYEQNSLFAGVLRTIGFDVRGLGARVLWGQADDAVTGRTHMLLHVKHRDVAYAVDVGFGAFTPTGVLMLEPGTEQPTPHGPFRLVDEGETLRMQAQTESGWRSLYRFDLTPQYGPDYEIANYFLSTNPASHFVHSLIAARAPEGRRLTLLNRTMTLRGLDGTVQRHEFGSAAEVCEALRNEFGVEFDEEATLLERLRSSFSQTAET